VRLAEGRPGRRASRDRGLGRGRFCPGPVLFSAGSARRVHRRRVPGRAHQETAGTIRSGADSCLWSARGPSASCPALCAALPTDPPTPSIPGWYDDLRRIWHKSPRRPAADPLTIRHCRNLGRHLPWTSGRRSTPVLAPPLRQQRPNERRRGSLSSGRSANCG
jgi:hypothetical protein